MPSSVHNPQLMNFAGSHDQARRLNHLFKCVHDFTIREGCRPEMPVRILFDFRIDVIARAPSPPQDFLAKERQRSEPVAPLPWPSDLDNRICKEPFPTSLAVLSEYSELKRKTPEAHNRANHKPY